MSYWHLDVASVDRVPCRSQSDQEMTPQQPRTLSAAVRRTKNQTTQGTKRAIGRLLAKFNSVRCEAESILKKLEEISRQVAQGAATSRQDRSA